ncbi:hypothetical protein [Motilimonas sp. KMU-193]|uniref:hypothetical protein n=1 Tax=Motilimonas sp. KMU-193 TaxID=3388668 RepID=UPI00396B35B8
MNTNVTEPRSDDYSSHFDQRRLSWWQLFAMALLIAILSWSWQGAEIAPMKIYHDAGNMLELGADFFRLISPILVTTLKKC